MATLNLPAGQINLKGPQAPTGVDRWISSEAMLALTGLALTCALSVAVPAGALVIKGPARASVLATFSTAGSLGFTGLAPRVERDIAAAPLTFTGLAPTLATNTVGNTVTLGAGGEVWQGLILTVRTGDLVINVPDGSLVIKGPARPEVRPALDVGSLPFTGHVLTLAIDAPGSAVAMSVGSVPFTGYAPLRLTSVVRDLPAGTLNLSGRYVAVAFKQPDAGSLIWQGLAPTITATSAFVAFPGKGTIALTGLAPTCHLSAGIPAGQLVIATPVMQVAATGLIAVPAGQLVLTGQAATAHLVWTIPAGSLVLTGQTPALGYTREHGASALTFTGYAVDLSGDHAISHPVGRVVFTGAPINLSTTRVVIDNGEVLAVLLNDGSVTVVQRVTGYARFR